LRSRIDRCRTPSRIHEKRLLSVGFAAFSRQRKRFETYRRFVTGFLPQFAVSFSARNRRLIFRSVVTMLAGKWNVACGPAFTNQLFFGMVSSRNVLKIARSISRRDRDMGYQRNVLQRFH
jgi:hypothetical protein